MIFPPKPSKECVKVSHVIFDCRVINHHPFNDRQVNNIVIIKAGENIPFSLIRISEASLCDAPNEIVSYESIRNCCLEVLKASPYSSCLPVTLFEGLSTSARVDR